jgi:hypothetical protein
MDKAQSVKQNKYPAITFELTPGTATITPKGGDLC